MPGAFHSPYSVHQETFRRALVSIIDGLMGDARTLLDGGFVTCDMCLICGVFDKIRPATTKAWIKGVVRYILPLQAKVGINANEKGV